MTPDEICTISTVIVRGNLCVCREDLWVRDGKILNPEKLFFDEEGFADHKVDCGSKIIAPGFIDVQINGKQEHKTNVKVHSGLTLLHSPVCVKVSVLILISCSDKLFPSLPIHRWIWHGLLPGQQ